MLAASANAASSASIISLILIGLDIYRKKPASKPLSMFCRIAFALTAITGISAVLGSARDHGAFKCNVGFLKRLVEKLALLFDLFACGIVSANQQITHGCDFTWPVRHVMGLSPFGAVTAFVIFSCVTHHRKNYASSIYFKNGSA